MTVDDAAPVDTSAATMRLQCETIRMVLKQLSTPDSASGDEERRLGLITAGTMALLKLKVCTYKQTSSNAHSLSEMSR